MNQITIERFWSKVDKTGSNGCWVWTGAKNGSGRPFSGIGQGNKVRLAHRLSYEFAYGPIPEGLLVCHHCDNPACVRPDHLFLGTQSDNLRDAYRKGRLTQLRPAPSGVENQNAKLTDEMVRAIRAEVGQTHRQLAKKYHVTHGTITAAISRKSWRHVK